VSENIWAKVVAHSINPCNVRITTLEVSFPRYVLAEVNTHRVFSRNTASHRALPATYVIQQVCDNPFIPTRFPLEAKGMQAKQWVTQEGHPDEFHKLRTFWLQARDRAVEQADLLRKRGVHKQLVNRLVEPFAWTRMVITATKWINFLNLRTDENADDHIQMLARAMQTALNEAIPTFVPLNGWHLPFVQPEEKDLPTGEKIHLCVGRCARTSYLTHDKRRDVQKDYDLHDDLVTHGHMSPTEHPAQAVMHSFQRSNFDPTWLQYRKQIIGEEVWVPSDERLSPWQRSDR
jgi:thymidylate synthase ThyX